MLAVLFSHGAEDPVHVHAPSEADYDDFGLDWTGNVETFDDSTWAVTNRAPNGVGYDRTGVYDALLGVDLEASMHGVSPTLFVRAAFDVDDPNIVDSLMLNLRYDDGYIVWLNGTEVARANAATLYPAWNETATGEHQASTTGFVAVDLADAIANLRSGANLLAIRGLNVSVDDEDALIQFTLVGERRTGPPLAVNDAAATLENAPVSVDVLANDQEGSDPIDPMSLNIAAPPAHGTAAVNANGTITYTPDAAYFGEDSFTYTVRDNTGMGQPTQQTLVASNAAVRVFVPANDNLGTTWRGAAAFNDEAWTAGSFGVGYDTNPSGVDFNPYLRTNVQSAMQNINTSIYMRTPFMLADRNDVVGLTLRMRYDDGFAAFVNGVPVASVYAPAPLSYNSPAVGNLNGDSDAIVFQNFNLTPFLSALRTGNNILAIQGLNQSLGSSDLLMQPELIATIAPRGQVSNVATVTVNVSGVDHAPVALEDDYSISVNETLVAESTNTPVFADDFSSGLLAEAWTFSSSNLDVFDERVRATENGRNITTRDSFTGELRVELDVEKQGTDNHGCWDYGVGLFGKVGVLRFESNGVVIAVGDSTNAICGGSPINTMPGSGINRGRLTMTFSDSVVEFSFRNENGTVITAQSPFTNPGTPSPLSIRIAAHPNTPRFVDNVNVYPGGAVPGVLANDTDADLDVLTAVLVEGPANGTLALDPEGTFSYTPNAGFIGLDTFTYRANDGGLDSNLATVTITVALPTADFGDAPQPYPTTEAENGARHEATGPKLGATRDAEWNGIHTAAADGAADDDGVSFGAIRVGQLGATATVDVQNAPAGARLDAWIDFNADGSWAGPGEQIVSGTPVVEGQNTIGFDVPSWAIDGQTFARFRLSTAGNLGILGAAGDGEVEDHAVAILQPFETIGDFGGEQTISSAADGAVSVFAVDLDGDGDMDMVSASVQDYQIAWHENDGNQAFTAHTISIRIGQSPLSVVAVDMDGDGDKDILAASNQRIDWFENDGSQVFTAHIINSSIFYRFSMVAADFDGDGDVDVFSPGYSESNENADGKIAWFENDGNQGFTMHTISSSQQAESAFAADMDGDGDMDVVCAVFRDNKIFWYENFGRGFSNLARTITNSDGAWNVFAADVDRDGDMDVLSASPADDRIAWYENDGSQSFTARTISVTADAAQSVFATDVDGDGDTDVLSASYSDAKIAWYENDGNQNFVASTISTTAAGASSVFAADIDGDGDLDILSASFDDDKIAWYENRGAPCSSCADDYSVNEDATLAVDTANGVLTNDGPQQGEILTAEGATAPSHGTVSLATDGSFTYTPNANYFGTDTFTYRITSNQREPLDAVVTLTINSVPDAPIAVGDAYSAESGIPLRAMATLVVDPTPRDETLVPFNAIWSFMHPTNGQDPAVGDADFHTTWQLGGAAYNGPAFHPGAAMLGYGTIDYGPIATNIGTPSAGSRFTAYFRGTFELDEYPEAVTTLTAQILADDGAVVYLNGQRVGLLNMSSETSGNYFDRSASTGSESQTFDVVLDRTALVRGTNVLAVSVHNTEPFSSDLGFALRLDARIVPDPDPVGVLVNDTDADGDSVSPALIAGPYHGTLDLRADGTFTYTPDTGFEGVDQFTYRATDGTLSSEPALVTINVGDANEAPLAGDDRFVAWGGNLVVTAATGVLANDFDANGDSLEASIFAAPAHGALTLAGDGSFTYSPHNDFLGVDTFTYRVADDSGTFGFATATVHVLRLRDPINAIPLAGDDVFQTQVGAVLDVAEPGVLANDRDAELRAMHAVVDRAPWHGSLSFASNGGFVYTPRPGYSGSDSFTYRATDGNTFSIPATVTINVTAAMLAVPIIVGPGAAATTTLPNGTLSQAPNSQSPATIPVIADVNGDGRVDRTDLAAVVALYGTTFATSTLPIPADVNRDGRVSLADAIAIRNAFSVMTRSPSAIVQQVTRRPSVRAVDEVFALSARRGSRTASADFVESNGESNPSLLPRFRATKGTFANRRRM